MALNGFSAFYYGFNIDGDNQNINFNEGSGELSAAITINDYSAEGLMTAIKTALDAISTLPQVYTVDFDRLTRKVTISSTSNFDLLTNTGTQLGTSPWTLLGFDITSDHTGSNTYTSENPAGSIYKTQYPLQDYIKPGLKKQRIDSSVNESANGDLEVLNFGQRTIVEMNMLFITDLGLGGYPFRYDSNGVQNALDFLEFATTKSRLEFMEDYSNPNVYYTMVLESTPQSNKGTDYFLRPETDKNLPDIYTTGLLTFRLEG